MILTLCLLVGSEALQVGLVGSCGDSPCVATLTSTEIQVDINGAVATASLRQVFRGSSTGPSTMRDAYFVFPIHAGLVVTNLTAEIDGQLIQAQVLERAEARAVYETAKNAQCRVALAEHGIGSEQTMDLYRVSLGNIPTQKPSYLNFSYVQELDLQEADLNHEGFLRFMVPALVGTPSRYGNSQADRFVQDATHQDTLVELHVRVQPPAQLSSPSHKLMQLESAASARLRGEDVSRDFVLHVHFPQDRNLFRPRAVLEQHPTLKSWVAVAEVVPRFSHELLTDVEVAILVDRSGSMSGDKMLFTRQALEHFIRSCPLDVMIDIIGFGTRLDRLRHPSFQQALRWAQDMQADLGGTDIGLALKEVFQREPEASHRRLLLLTDGEVWNAKEVIDTARRHCKLRCEIHTLGVGSGVSTETLRGLAHQGTATFLNPGEEEELQETVARILVSALQPPVELQVHWPQDPEPGPGILQEAVLSPSELLKLATPAIQSFRSQGFRRGPVAVPPPRLRSGQRWSAYAFLGHLSRLPDELRITGTMNGGEFELSLPVHITQGRSVHSLAAWQMAELLDGGTQLSAPGFPEDSKSQVIALGLTFGIATSKTSWIALGEPTSKSKASSLTQGSHSVLDSASMGSSLSLRSFSRSGSSLSILGLARLGSTFSVLDLSSMALSLSLRSFSRLGSSLSVLDCLMLGSSMSVRAFARLGSSLSIFRSPDLTPGELRSEVQTLPLRGFVGIRVSPFLSIPVLMVTRDAGCRATQLQMPKIQAELGRLTWSSQWTLASRDLEMNASEPLRLENCTLWASGRFLMRLEDSDFEAVAYEDDSVAHPHLEDASQWGCPPLGRDAYFALLGSQQADGSFQWPRRFFQNLHFPAHELGGRHLATALAVAALRRCFPRWGGLVELKAVAWLRAELPTWDEWISFANAAVLQRLMWKEAHEAQEIMVSV